MPGRSLGGICRAWPPGLFLAGEAAVSPSQAPSMGGGYPGTLRMCGAHSSLVSFLSDLLRLLPSNSCSRSNNTSPLLSSCAWRKVNCLATEGFGGERCPRDSVTKDVRSAHRGAFQEGEPWPPPPVSCEIREFDPRSLGSQESWKGS